MCDYSVKLGLIVLAVGVQYHIEVHCLKHFGFLRLFIVLLYTQNQQATLNGFSFLHCKSITAQCTCFDCEFC
jgi:hypothetical protein